MIPTLVYMDSVRTTHQATHVYVILDTLAHTVSRRRRDLVDLVVLEVSVLSATLGDCD